jgi:hypothetical protein
MNSAWVISPFSPGALLNGKRRIVPRMNVQDELKVHGNKVETSNDLEESEALQAIEKEWSHPPESNRRPTDYELSRTA